MARRPVAKPEVSGEAEEAASSLRAVNTRERLVEHAIQLFARHGFEGISLRNLMLAAGAKNTGAIHYHFGDRETLILAAIDLVIEAITTDVTEAEAEMLGISLSPPGDDVRSILSRELLPLMTLPYRKPWGMDAVKLLARIIMGEARYAAPRLENGTIAASREIVGRLAGHLPHIPTETLSLRVEFAYVNLICGMAAMPYLDAIEEAELTVAPSDTKLANSLLDYVTGGIAAAESYTLGFID
jgi:AcrR family transcriptional regulator